MGDLTKSFSYKEFDCKSGRSYPAEVKAMIGKLAQNLQMVRDYFASPVSIVSGYRDPVYNAELVRKSKAKNNGKSKVAEKSQHMYGKAADINVRGYEPAELLEVIYKLIEQNKMVQGGVGYYAPSAKSLGWVHYDVRGQKARWDGT